MRLELMRETVDGMILPWVRRANDGRRWWVAREIGRALGVPDDGKRLVRSATSSGIEGHDYVKVSRVDAALIVALLRNESISSVRSDSACGSIVLLSDAGLRLVLSRMRSGASNALRLWIDGSIVRPPNDSPRDDRVYFVRAGLLVKIGLSADPARRVRSMRVGSPVPLELLGSMAGTRDTEKRIHRRFSALREHGEWFRFEDALATFIRANASETFLSLPARSAG